MNIYSQKKVWKISLIMVAIIIVAVSLFYTNNLVKKIAEQERKNLNIWAEAIQKKANLVAYTQELFEKIADEERKKVELWAKGSQQLASADVEVGNLNFIFEVIRNNQTIPVILVDDKNKIISSINLDSSISNNDIALRTELELMKREKRPIVIEIAKGKRNYLFYRDSKLFFELKNNMNDIIKSFISEIVSNSASVPAILTDSTGQNALASGNIDDKTLSSPKLLKERLALMALENTPVEIKLGADNAKRYLYFEESALLKRLRYYPFAQLFIIGIFLLIAYYLFSTARKSEQNQVWVGMSKETAHQLGTPLSSLMAWLEILKTQDVDESILVEIEKDIERLNTITERFSKVGSEPKLEQEDMPKVVSSSLDYLKHRLSNKVVFKFEYNENEVLTAPVCVPLFDWVLENIIKNAVDAMNGEGKISVHISKDLFNVMIDITDTGKGIEKKNFKSVFEPGFTTKKRGWGLGLSLTKRIVEQYHKGKIFVKDSEIGVGTTFRIVLPVN